MEELTPFSYRDLQAVAKHYKVRANTKRSLLVANIVAARGKDCGTRACLKDIIDYARLNQTQNRLRLNRRKSVIQQNENMSVVPFDHSSKQLKLSGSSCASPNDNLAHYDCKAYSNPCNFFPPLATELETVCFSAFANNDFVGNSFQNEIYSRYAARKSDSTFPLNQFLQNDLSDTLDARRYTYYSSNTFYHQSYMSLPAIDNRDSTSSSNEFYRTTNDVNYCALSSSQNIGCNESSIPPNNACYHNDRSRALSTDYISSSNNDNLAVRTCYSTNNYTAVVPTPQVEVRNETNWQTMNVHDSNTTTNWAVNSKGIESNKEMDYSAPVINYASSFSNAVAPTTADVTNDRAEFDESSPDTPEAICFPEEIARLFTNSNMNAKTEVSIPQTLSSSSGYSSANSNAASSIQYTTMNGPSANASSSTQSAAFDYPLTNYHNLDTVCGSVDNTATMHSNYELYYQPYWTNSYNDPTSISANVRSDTTTTATVFTEPTTTAYSLPSFSSCFTNTNKTGGKGYEYTNSQQHWSSYYDGTANAYPYAYNVPYSTPVQPSNNVANGLMDYTPSPEPNCIDLTKIDDTGNNCATPLSVDDSSSASSLTIMEDADCDANSVSEAGFRNEKLLEDNYNHDSLMERSKIVCQHLPVKSIQEVRQLVQTYSPKVSCLVNETQNEMNDGKKKSSSVKDVEWFPTRHPCAYKLEGCDYVSKQNYTRSHEKHCFYQPIYCPSDSCAWRNSLNSLSKHICECHEVEKRSVKLYMIDRLTEDREKECYTFYQAYENTIYIVRLRIYNERSLAYVTIQYIPQGQSSTTNKRHYKGSVKLLSFTSKKIEKKEWKGMIQQYIETENKNVKDGCSIQINIRSSEYVIALVSIDREN